SAARSTSGPLPAPAPRSPGGSLSQPPPPATSAYRVAGYTGPGQALAAAAPDPATPDPGLPEVSVAWDSVRKREPDRSAVCAGRGAAGGGAAAEIGAAAGRAV